mmetsp:Transcript_17772/g.36198  ORF Transcript_17772/g.36198 Transcript_17772/m.36198 type:complete len:253 (-) Transcript_17772:18-776(-)
MEMVLEMLMHLNLQLTFLPWREKVGQVFQLPSPVQYYQIGVKPKTGLLLEWEPELSCLLQSQQQLFYSLPEQSPHLQTKCLLHCNRPRQGPEILSRFQDQRQQEAPSSLGAGRLYKVPTRKLFQVCRPAAQIPHPRRRPRPDGMARWQQRQCYHQFLRSCSFCFRHRRCCETLALHRFRRRSRRRRYQCRSRSLPGAPPAPLHLRSMDMLGIVPSDPFWWLRAWRTSVCPLASEPELEDNLAQTSGVPAPPS